MPRSLAVFVFATLVSIAWASASLAQVGTEFTYQGELENSGAVVTSPTDMNFSLWSAASGGVQIGTTVSLFSIPVSSGLFTVSLDFGVSPYTTDQALWLQIDVRNPAGSGSYVSMTTRQKLTTTPFSMATRGISVDASGNVSLGTSTAPAKLVVSTTGAATLNETSNFDPSTVTLNQVRLGHVHAANGFDVSGFCVNQGGPTMAVGISSGNCYWGYLSSSTTMDTKMQLTGSSGNLFITGTIAQGSSERRKKDIHFLSAAELQEALHTLEATPVATYRYKTASEASKVNYGVIAEHTPPQLLSDDDQAVNLSNTIGVLIAAVKAQEKQIDVLQAEVRELRKAAR